MHRRTFMAGFCSTIALWPLVAHSRQGNTAKIGYLGSNSIAEGQDHISGLRQGLNDGGYIEGQNLVIEFRWADNAYARLPALAAELIALKVDVIVAQAPPAAQAAKAATQVIPIVFGVGSDPVASGLVASLARPGGNLTGITLLISDLMAKRFALMADLVPHARHMAVLVNPNISHPWVESVEKIARERSIQLMIIKAATPGDIDAAFETMTRGKVDAVIIGEDPFLGLTPQIPALAKRQRLPLMGVGRVTPMAGGLVSYGTSLKDAFVLVGDFVARILDGAKPADLAVRQPTKFEMVLNLRNANELGLVVPPLLLAQADDVIE